MSFSPPAFGLLMNLATVVDPRADEMVRAVSSEEALGVFNARSGRLGAPLSGDRVQEPCIEHVDAKLQGRRVHGVEAENQERLCARAWSQIPPDLPTNAWLLIMHDEAEAFHDEREAAHLAAQAAEHAGGDEHGGGKVQQPPNRLAQYRGAGRVEDVTVAGERG
eukprot:CAMPEP_0119353490 /NCGR_PEP_ID=MMETSP1334-20130426/2613_1 /TAXON_ID=127549 /ORGANISM="Calcidiscus leptoporus, Strain RCC1130" /LENGTH=163 /DNA_ID=CAMNT_0007366783 /DNA_START=217 /DNA_END=710 /DNA_ORIENTATION=-